MTQENKSRLIKFLWNLASAVLAAIGTALGVSCAVAQPPRTEHQDTKLTSMRPRLKELNDNPYIEKKV